MDAISNFVASPFCPALCGRFGRRRVYMAALCLEAGAALLLGNLQLLSRGAATIPLFVVLFALTGAATAATYTAAVSTAAECFPRTLPRAIGMQEAAMGLGFVAGPPLGGALFRLLRGIRAPYTVAGIALLAAAPLAGPALPGAHSAPAAESGGTSPAARCEDGGNTEGEGMSAAKLLSLPGVRTTLLCALVGGSALGFVSPTLAPHWERVLHADPGQIGGLLGLAAFAYVVGAGLLGAVLADSVGLRRCLLAGLCFLGVTAICFATIDHVSRPGAWTIQAVLSLTFGFGAALTIGPGMPLLQRQASAGVAGAVLPLCAQKALNFPCARRCWHSWGKTQRRSSWRLPCLGAL